MDASTAWEDYLADVSLGVAGLQRRLEDPEEILFSNEDVCVRITDVSSDGESSFATFSGLSLSAFQPLRRLAYSMKGGVYGR